MSEQSVKKWVIIAILFSIIAIGISESITTGDTLGLQIVVNNTNLAPFVAGHGGTGERIGNNTTYWNNNTPIEIFLYSHANTSGTAAEIHLFINGTKVSDTSGRALGIAEQSNRSIVAIIPQYSFYSVEFINYHHIEWYEYQILTGNVTTNTTGGSGTMDHAFLSNLNWSVAGHIMNTTLDMNNNSIVNCTNCWNATVNDTKVNKTGDTMTGTLKINPTSDGALNITTGTINTSMTVNSTTSKSGLTNEFTVDIIGQDVFGLRIGNFVNGSGQGAGIQAVSGQIGKTATKTGERAGFMLFKGTFESTTPGSGLSSGAGFLSYNTENQSSTNQGADLRLVATTTGTTTRPTIIQLIDGQIVFPQLTGVGSVYLCINATGYVYRGAPGC